MPQALAHSLRKEFLHSDLFKEPISSLMVLSVASLDFRGDSADDSGVVPHEESRPLCDIEEAGDPVMEVDDPRWTLGIRL